MSLVPDSVNLSLRAALDLRYRRHELLAHNVANTDTPGFRPKDLEFEGVLQTALTDTGTGSGAVGGLSPDESARAIADAGTQKVIERPEVGDTLDENKLDIDREFARIADNSLHYQATTEILRRRYGMLRQAIADVSRG